MRRLQRLAQYMERLLESRRLPQLPRRAAFVTPRSPRAAVSERRASTLEALPDQIERIPHALTTAELARWLAVSRITVFKLAKAGRIPCFRIGTCIRFDPKVVAHWLRTSDAPVRYDQSWTRKLH